MVLVNRVRFLLCVWDEKVGGEGEVIRDFCSCTLVGAVNDLNRCRGDRVIRPRSVYLLGSEYITTNCIQYMTPPSQSNSTAFHRSKSFVVHHCNELLVRQAERRK